MKPTLLLVMPDLGPGGAQPMNLRLAHELQKRGWSVRIAVLFDRWRVLGEDTCSGLDIVILGSTGLLAKMRGLMRLMQLARNSDIVIGGMECAATTYGYLAARMAKRPFVSWTHIAFHLHQARLGFIGRAISHFIYRRVQWVVFPSQGAWGSLRQVLGKQPTQAKWEVIENFLHAYSLSQTPPEAMLYAKPVVLGLGRLDMQKAFDRLIRAHAALISKGIDHHLIILGEGSQRQILEAEISRLSVEHSVFLPGHVIDVFGWLNHATVFALCSKYEGFALVVLEALSCGIPTVAMDCPSGPREILQDGWAGLLTPEGDELAFQKALAKLLTSAELRATYAARGKERAENYLPERIVPMWEQLFMRVFKDGHV